MISFAHSHLGHKEVDTGDGTGAHATLAQMLLSPAKPNLVIHAPLADILDRTPGPRTHKPKTADEAPMNRAADHPGATDTPVNAVSRVEEQTKRLG